MNSFSNDEDDQFFSKLELDEITALEQTVIVAQTVDNTSANTTASGGFDDDDDVFFIGDFETNQVEDKAGVAAGTSVNKVKVAPVVVVAGPSSSLSSHHNNAPFKKPYEKVKPPISKTTKCADDSWTDFLCWFEKQQSFKTPWFSSIPISGLNVSQCKSIITCCKDPSSVAQFGSIVMSFFKEINASAETREYHHLRDSSIQLIELLLLRMEKDFIGNNRSSILSNQDEFSAIFEDILATYVIDKKTFRTSRIPELLVKLYPKAFSDILSEAVKTGNVELVIPVCSKNPAMFQKIMQSLCSGDCYSKSGVPEDDPDFQNYTISPQKFATDLIELLEKTLGSSYLSLFPAKLQPIFSFDSVVCKHNDLATNNMIITEMCCLLNDLFCECTADSSINNNNNFLSFLVNMLPFTSKILNDKNLMRNIKFKDFPYLWIKVRNSNHFWQ